MFVGIRFDKKTDVVELKVALSKSEFNYMFRTYSAVF